MATHNLSRAYGMADRFILMRDGAVVRCVEKQGVSADQLRELYACYAESDAPTSSESGTESRRA